MDSIEASKAVNRLNNQIKQNQQAYRMQSASPVTADTMTTTINKDAYQPEQAASSIPPASASSLPSATMDSDDELQAQESISHHSPQNRRSALVVPNRSEQVYNETSLNSKLREAQSQKREADDEMSEARRKKRDAQDEIAAAQSKLRHAQSDIREALREIQELKGNSVASPIPVDFYSLYAVSVFLTS
jgi:hypothetical protein